MLVVEIEADQEMLARLIVPAQAWRSWLSLSPTKWNPNVYFRRQTLHSCDIRLRHDLKTLSTRHAQVALEETFNASAHFIQRGFRE